MDDLNKQRAEITYKFVPRSDTVVFVLDATTAVRRTEVEFLESSILASGIERLILSPTSLICSIPKTSRDSSSQFAIG